MRNDIIDLILEGNTSQAVRIDLSSGMFSFDAVTEDIHRIKQLYDEQAQSRLSELKSVFNLSLIKVGSMMGLILLLAAGVLTVVERGKRLRVIQLSEERLNAVIESINDGMFVVAHEGQVEMVNQAAEKRWAQPRDSMIGRQLSDIVPDLRETPIPEAIKECVRTEQAMTVRNVKVMHDQSIYMKLGCFPLKMALRSFLMMSPNGNRLKTNGFGSVNWNRSGYSQVVSLMILITS
jgi:PAS domain S-box-containing protein